MRHRIEISALLITLTLFAVGFFGCGGRQSLANLSVRELFELGKDKHENKKYIEAVEIFQTVIYNYPGEPIVDTAQYFLALSYYGSEDYELAQVEFNRLVINYPSSVYFENAIFMKAACFFEGTPRHYGLDQSDLERAIKQFEDYVIDYPESELFPEAQRMLLVARTRMAKKFYESGITYIRMGARGSAQKYFQKVIDEYTDTEYAALATYKSAEADLGMKKYTDAQKGFEDFKVVFPDHELVKEAEKLAAEAAFKAGEKAFKNGDTELAKEKFEALLALYPNSKKAKDADKYLKQIESRLSSGS